MVLPSRALRAGCARNPTQPGQRRKLGAANGLSPLALQRSAESSALAAPARIVAAREDSQGIAMQRSGVSGLSAAYSAALHSYHPRILLRSKDFKRRRP